MLICRQTFDFWFSWVICGWWNQTGWRAGWRVGGWALVQSRGHSWLKWQSSRSTGYGYKIFEWIQPVICTFICLRPLVSHRSICCCRFLRCCGGCFCCGCCWCPAICVELYFIILLLFKLSAMHIPNRFTVLTRLHPDSALWLSTLLLLPHLLLQWRLCP